MVARERRFVKTAWVHIFKLFFGSLQKTLPHTFHVRPNTILVQAFWAATFFSGRRATSKPQVPEWWSFTIKNLGLLVLHLNEQNTLNPFLPGLETLERLE